MEMQITVVHTLAPEIIEMLKGLRVAPAASSQEIATISEVKKLPEKQRVTVKATELEKKENVDVVTTVDLTIEQVRAAVAKKSQDGKREAIKAILAEFKVPNVTSLKKEQYADFLTGINAL